METLQKRHIGDLVAEDYRTATVFKKHKIDFCCNGGRSIEDACKAKDISIWQLLRELEEAMTSNDNSNTDYKQWPLDLLADYIEKKHHRYVEQRIQEIIPFLDKLCKVHGGRHPELLEIYQLFTEAAGELTQHMKKEELILFPHIRKMVEAKAKKDSLEAPHFGSVSNPISMMEHEHDSAGNLFREIARLSDDYNPPADACNTYRVTFALLKEFEDDLHMHIHLENNILFPGAEVLEKELNAEKNQATV